MKHNPDNDKQPTRHALAGVIGLIGAASLVACGGGGGGDGGAPGPVGPAPDGNGSAPELAGSWGGTVERTNGATAQFDTITAVFNANGDLSQLVIAGVDQDFTAQVDSTTDESALSSTIYTFTADDGSRFALISNAADTHAALLFDDESVVVLQKGSSSQTYAANDAAGNWTGEIFELDGGFGNFGAIDTTASLTGTTSVSGTVNVSDDFNGESCTGLQVSLGAPDSSFGVYENTTITGGTGNICAGSETFTFDAFMSDDANFMVIGFVAGEPGSGCTTAADACGLAIYERGTGGGGMPSVLSGDWAGSQNNGTTTQSISATFDDEGDISSIDINGGSRTATQTSGPVVVDGFAIYGFDDNASAAEYTLYVAAGNGHAALSDHTGSFVAVLEKDGSGSYASTDAVGDWSGALFFDPAEVSAGATAAGVDRESFTVTYTNNAGSIESDNLSVAAGEADQCTNIDVVLDNFDASFGTYSGVATGGDQPSECPGTDLLDFDTIVSLDATFAVVGFVGGEPGDACFAAGMGSANDTCPLGVMTRQ